MSSIVITGMGVVSAIGIGKEENLESLRSMRGGVAPVHYLATEHRECMVGEVKLTNDDAESITPSRQKLRQVRLLIHFKDADERRQREKILTDELPARIVEEAGKVICVVETPDPLQIYPRLWKFQPWAEILAGADGLRDRMRRDTLEALKNYAEPV